MEFLGPPGEEQSDMANHYLYGRIRVEGGIKETAITVVVAHLYLY